MVSSICSQRLKKLIGSSIDNASENVGAEV